MRVDVRRTVVVPVGLVAAGTLFVSGVIVASNDAVVGHSPAAHARSVDREGIEERIAREQRAGRYGTRQHLAPAPEPKPVAAPAATGPADDRVWERLRTCETGGRYDRNSGNGYYGAYQFSARTWRSLGYTGLPHQAAPEVQDAAARKLQARSGWGQWPACARRIGVS